MKSSNSQLTEKDLAELFEKSSLKDRYFFPRKVPVLFPFQETKKPSKKEQSDQNEKPVEKN